MITIKHRFTDATLCEFDVATLKEAVVKAVAVKKDLQGADLQGAYLQGAYLRDAYLQGADLQGAEIDGEKITKAPLSIDGLRYWCLISDGFMRLGCKRFTHAEWVEFNDEQISDMDGDALEFWSKYGSTLLAMCNLHAAT